MAETWSDTKSRVRAAYDTWSAKGCLIALYQNGLCSCEAAVKNGRFVKGGREEIGPCAGQFSSYPDDISDIHSGGGEG